MIEESTTRIMLAIVSVAGVLLFGILINAGRKH